MTSETAEDNSSETMPSKAGPSITLVPQLPADVVVYEYGIKLDAECINALVDQIMRARRLYNELVAVMRRVILEVRAFTLENAGDEARQLAAEVEHLSEAFKVARARNDEEAMKQIAQQRRDARRRLYPLLSSARKTLKAQIAPMYKAVGSNAEAETYQIRTRYRDEGLGFATATAVLQAALASWKKTLPTGGMPQFSVGSEKMQDTLTLQFTVAGGVEADKLLSGRHAELQLLPPKTAASRYGEFAFRLGNASANAYATGTWEYHRPLPDGSKVAMARLVARRRASGFEHALQLLVKLPTPMRRDVPLDRKPLVCVHFGWALDDDGRRVAGVSSDADPGFASLVMLPESIEKDLARASDIQSLRDSRRNDIVSAVKAFEHRGLSDELTAELSAIRRLPPEHVAHTRLHRLSYQLSDSGVEIPGLTAWRKWDRKVWSESYNIARKARNRRREFYMQMARDLVRAHAAICIEPLDLAKAAIKVDESSGERGDFGAKARRGRTAAGLFELRRAVAWECVKTHTPLIELAAGPTVTSCAHCGEGPVTPHGDGVRDIQCVACGSVTDRKLHGAARAYQLVFPDLPRLLEEHSSLLEVGWAEAVRTREERKAKMAEGRRKKRAERATGGSAPTNSERSGDGPAVS